MKGFFATTIRHVLGYFLAGAFAILPLVITVLIVAWVVAFLESLLGPNTFLGKRLSEIGLRFVGNDVVAYILGWLVVLSTIFLLGIVIELGAKKLIHRLVDGIFRRVPLIGKLYDASRQLVDMLDKKDETELKSMSAVFCHFGKDSGAAVLALLPSPERFHIDGRDYHVILIPTAPVPFGGGLFFVPVESVRPAGMPVEGLMSIYVSMGATVPQYLPRIEMPKSAEPT